MSKWIEPVLTGFSSEPEIDLKALVQSYLSPDNLAGEEIEIRIEPDGKWEFLP
ncbi:MAG: hypothetical protein HC879_14870 [Leptolyngbyaceae cyanobacterium SL_5_9]|nr:hypothetical protein [Leptolyngbyaceae cyanobacterium SL_5_9]NJO76368.1 hypothetical protein [Leptolyngbyaceae cyanobacterium RM1_406_9]